jgi:hypothetical protein
MRHFVATTLLTAGVDLATVAGRLGHGGGGKTTLAIYGHFLSEPDREASNVMSRLLTLPGRDDPLRGVAGSRHDVQLPQPGVGGTPIFDEYPTNTRAGKAQGASRCRDAEPSL